MLEEENRVSGSCDGRWYVRDDVCASCGNCMQVVNSSRLLRPNEERKAYFYRQPKPGEEQLAEEIKSVCPTGAIWDNGDFDSGRSEL